MAQSTVKLVKLDPVYPGQLVQVWRTPWNRWDGLCGKADTCRSCPILDGTDGAQRRQFSLCTNNRHSDASDPWHYDSDMLNLLLPIRAIVKFNIWLAYPLFSSLFWGRRKKPRTRASVKCNPIQSARPLKEFYDSVNMSVTDESQFRIEYSD